MTTYIFTVKDINESKLQVALFVQVKFGNKSIKRIYITFFFFCLLELIASRIVETCLLSSTKLCDNLLYILENFPSHSTM